MLPASTAFSAEAAQEMADERRRRGLAVGAGDGDDARSLEISRGAISISLTIGTPASRAAASGGRRAERSRDSTTTSDARAIRARSWPPSRPIGAESSAACSRCPSTAESIRSRTHRLAVRRRAEARATAVRSCRARARRSRPSGDCSRCHLSFSVLSATKAQRIPRIQKRTTTWALIPSALARNGGAAARA